MGRKPTVIKEGTANGVEGRGLRRFRLTDVMAEAQALVAAARAEAARITREAGAEADAIRRAAKEEGYRAGAEQGAREGREAGRAEAFEAARQAFADQHRSLVESCRQTIAGINAGRAAWEASARRDLIDLAMAIARRVARHVGQRDREVVRANLEEAIRLAGSRSEVAVLVNPVDAESARQFAPSLVEFRDECEHVRVVEDPEVSPGGCRIQWGSGVVDAGLEAQLDRIEAELRAETAGESNAGDDVVDS